MLGLEVDGFLLEFFNFYFSFFSFLFWKEDFFAVKVAFEALDCRVAVFYFFGPTLGHFVEAQMLESMEVDCIDESEVLTPADDEFQIDKRSFKTPFVCGCRDLGEALRRIHEGASMIRTKGEAGTGNVVEAVRHMRTLLSQIRGLLGMDVLQLEKKAVEMRVPFDLVAWVAERQKLPVPNFSAGGVATPADAALMMQLGAETVFVGSGIFKSGDPSQRAKAMVRAVAHFNEPKILVEISRGLGEAMVGIDINLMPAHERMAGRGV
jgi:pyridoxal 5'-phosphate synthase pdxS subunit